MVGKVEYAQFLHDASEIFFTDKQFVHAGDNVNNDNDSVIINIPGIRPDITVPVIELYLK